MRSARHVFVSVFVPVFVASLGMLVSLSAGAQERTRKIGVVVVADNPAEAGNLQALLTRKLEETFSEVDALDTQLVGREHESALITSEEVLKPATQAIEQASNFYYEANLAEAEKRMETAAKIYAASSGIPVGKWIHMHLWRATIFLGLKKQAEAREAIKQVVALDRTHKADLDVFPPSVQELIVQTAKALPEKLAVLRLTSRGMPPTANIQIDDQPVGVDSPSVSVPPGRHYIKISETSYRTFCKAVDVSTIDKEVPVGIVLALSQADEAELMAKGTKVLDRFLTTAPDGVIVVAMKAGNARVSTVARGKSSLPKHHGPFPYEASGAVEKILDLAAKDLGLRTATTGNGDRGTGVKHTRTDAGLALGVWSRQVSGTTVGDDLPAKTGGQPFSGFGPRIAAQTTWSGATARADVTLLTFQLSHSRAEKPGVEPRQGEGGTLANLHAGAGYQYGGRDPDDFALSALLGVVYESYNGKSPRAVTGWSEGVPLFVSYTRMAPELRVLASIPTSPGITIAAGADLGFGGPWTESPKVSGKTGAGGVALGVHGGARFQKRALRFGVDTGVELRTATFKGEAGPTSTLKDSEQTDIMLTIQGTAGIAF